MHPSSSRICVPRDHGQISIGRLRHFVQAQSFNIGVVEQRELVRQIGSVNRRVMWNGSQNGRDTVHA
jgi:hypothetical protein